MTGTSAQMKPTRTNNAHSPVTTAAKAEETLLNQYRKINGVVISHPRMASALRRIEDCRLTSKGAREPDCMLIIGDPGVGKTTLKDHYLSLHPRSETDDGTIVPVLAVTIPVPAKMANMATAMLAALGDPMPYKGSLDAKTRRLYKLIRACKVELIFLDEFHHFIDRDSDRVTRSVSDWLKVLISEVKVPVILTGLPAAREILEVNDQLRRRFSNQLFLNPFGWGRKGKAEFQKFMDWIEKSIEITSEVPFSEEDIARRFYFATNGYISFMFKIAKGAAFIAIKQGAKTITMEMLAQSYELYVYPMQGGARPRSPEENPFHPAWDPKFTIGKASKPGKNPTNKPSKSRAEARRAARKVFSTA